MIAITAARPDTGRLSCRAGYDRGCDDGGCIVVKAAGMPRLQSVSAPRRLKMLQVCCATHVFVGGWRRNSDMSVADCKRRVGRSSCGTATRGAGTSPSWWRGRRKNERIANMKSEGLPSDPQPPKVFRYVAGVIRGSSLQASRQVRRRPAEP